MRILSGVTTHCASITVSGYSGMRELKTTQAEVLVHQAGLLFRQHGIYRSRVINCHGMRHLTSRIFIDWKNSSLMRRCD
jgi:hypothetical protein